MKFEKLTTRVGKIDKLILPTREKDALLVLKHVDEAGKDNFEIAETLQEYVSLCDTEAAAVDIANSKGRRLWFNGFDKAAMVFKFRQNGGYDKCLKGAVKSGESLKSIIDVSEVVKEADEAIAFALEAGKNALAGAEMPSDWGISTARSPFETYVQITMKGKPDLTREQVIELVKSVAPVLGLEVPAGV